MNDQILKDILRRLQRLEQTSVRYRSGEVTDLAPLDVALGGSDVSYEDVQAIGPITDGAQVATLLWANDMVVLGNLNGGSRFGTQTVTWGGASPVSGTATVTHGLGTTPSAILFGAGPSSALTIRWDTKGAATFTMSARDVTGTPVLGATRDVDWLVIA